VQHFEKARDAALPEIKVVKKNIVGVVAKMAHEATSAAISDLIERERFMVQSSKKFLRCYEKCREV
jgi:hypothetical protein